MFCTGVSVVDDINAKFEDPNDMAEEDRLAEMGKPRLGDITTIFVNIRESEDFRVRK